MTAPNLMRRYSLFLCLVFGLSIASSAQSPNIPPGTLIAQDFQLRENTAKIVTPTYPSDAIRSGITGVAVVRLWIKPAGTISRVEVLQAPCHSIAVAVLDAVRQWKFRPVTVGSNSRPSPVVGKLVYYFDIIRGKAKVLSPAEAPVVGPQKPPLTTNQTEG